MGKQYDETLTMLKDLTDARAISGNEKEARDVMEKYITPVADGVETDHLGSLVAKKTGDADGRKIMVAGHLDEVGFIVTRIDDNGFISLQAIGGWWSHALLAQRVTVNTNDGDAKCAAGS